jgi:phospholipid/cholesterol/gamma-HCH transport system substrate-binding protein
LAVAATGLLVLAGLALVATIAFRAPNGLPFAATRTVHAFVPDVGNIRRHNEVRIAGVRVGQVTAKEVLGSRARLTLKLDGDVGALPADTKIFIRARGLLGQRYVELRPGSSRRVLANGAPLRGDAHTLTAGIPETLDIFDRQTRGALGDTIGELGKGMLARGRGLNDALRVAPQVTRDVHATVATLVARPVALRRLLPSIDRAAAAFQPAADDFAAGLAPAAAALEPLVDRRKQVRATLDEAPPALAAATPALVEARRLLAATRRLGDAARTTLPDAPAALRATSALVRDAPAPLRRTAGLLRTVRAAIPTVLRLGDRIAPVLAPLGHTLTTLRPVVGRLGRYGCDLDNFAENWRDFLGHGVPSGADFGPLTSIRMEIISGPGNIAGAGSALNAPDQLVDRDPYPRPCRFSPGRVYPLTGGRPR